MNDRIEKRIELKEPFAPRLRAAHNPGPLQHAEMFGDRLPGQLGTFG